MGDHNVYPTGISANSESNASQPVKTFVVNTKENTSVPFLRGILVRTLLEAGLPFEQAYDLATQVRDQLSETEEVTTALLREKVSALLLDRSDVEVRKRYRMPPVAPARILVISRGGSESTFSRSKHESYLQASGVRLGDAEEITAKIFDQLLAAGATSVGAEQLSFLTYLCLKQELGEKAAQQYLVRKEFQHSGRPLILMICGAVGSGKSTIATEIAHRLEIVRTQSTDMLREVMRMMIPKKLLPILHCSSFDAWKTLPIQEKTVRDKDMKIAEGYRSQADLLAVPCEAVMRRAVKESVPLILEGVHSHPHLVHCMSAENDAIIVHVTLAVMNYSELQGRLSGRGVDVPQRQSKRYLNKFDSIWRLQSFLVSEAERCDTPVIPNDDKEAAIFQVIGTVNAHLSQHFSGKPAEIFNTDIKTLAHKQKSKSWQQLVPLLITTKSARNPE